GRGARGGGARRGWGEADRGRAGHVVPRLRVIERHEVDSQGGLTAGLLLQQRTALLQATRARRVLVVLDFFGLIGVKGKGLSSLEEDHRRLSVLQEANALTRAPRSPTGDAVLVVSEVRKGEGGRVALALDDLLGSARLAYAAEAVLLLEQDERRRAGGEAVPLVLTLAKGRDGATRGKINLV